MRIFNQTCKDLMYEKTHCLYYDHEENESFDVNYIYQLPLDHIGDTGIVFSRWYEHQRELYVKNVTDF